VIVISVAESNGWTSASFRVNGYLASVSRQQDKQGRCPAWRQYHKQGKAVVSQELI
jgi:hypothetical protein